MKLSGQFFQLAIFFENWRLDVWHELNCDSTKFIMKYIEVINASTANLSERNSKTISQEMRWKFQSICQKLSLNKPTLFKRENNYVIFSEINLFRYTFEMDVKNFENYIHTCVYLILNSITIHWSIFHTPIFSTLHQER